MLTCTKHCGGFCRFSLALMNKGFFKVFILKTLIYQREQLFFL